MIKVDFDRRYDLIFGLTYCCNKDNNCNFNWVKSTYPKFDEEFYKMYKKAITPEFEEYIKNRGLDSYGRSVSIANSLNEKYEVIVNSEIEQIIERNPNFDSAKLSRLLSEFVKRANYEEFYASYASLRKNLVEKFKRAVNKFIVFTPSIIEEFYGYSIAPIEVKILNFSIGSYGKTFDNSITYVAGMSSYVNGQFEDYIISTLFHEFSHPYINPLGRKYFKDSDISNVYEEAENNGLDEPYYNSPITVVNEYVVRAVQIILGAQYFDEKATSKIIDNFKSRGYVHIEELIEIFNYKNNYDSFEDFYVNRIVSFFKELNIKINQEFKVMKKVDLNGKNSN